AASWAAGCFSRERYSRLNECIKRLRATRHAFLDFGGGRSSPLLTARVKNFDVMSGSRFETKTFQSSFVRAVVHFRMTACARRSFSACSLANLSRVRATAVAAFPHLREQ